ncbi:hypothetical protein [Arthrobacter sp. NyZ413]|uniref:hypothetical protein n=1 Tax=Arthrobacter sp. NyZ413 TaxID=3144669 RepID=UPI003BF7AC63
MLANPVFRIDLADYPANRSYDFTELERQMRWALQSLPTGANVRLIVHKYKPAGELSWLRTDLIIQIEATDPTVIAEWMSALTPKAAAA